MSLKSEAIKEYNRLFNTKIKTVTVHDKQYVDVDFINWCLEYIEKEILRFKKIAFDKSFDPLADVIIEVTKSYKKEV